MCLLQNFANTAQFCASTTRLKQILTSNDQVLYAHVLRHHGCFYTEVLLLKFLTQTFAHCTQVLLSRDASHASTFTHRCLYTGMLLQTKTFTHRRTGTSTHYTQMSLHSDAFTQECFYTHVLLRRGSFDTE